MNDVIIVAGKNDEIISNDGKHYIDFLSGYGSVIVGHSNLAVNKALKEQLDKLWISPNYNHALHSDTIRLIQSFLTGDYYVAELYSTGMESIEFSLRVAVIETGKKEFVGFSKSMHGKSLASASLSWKNSFGLSNFIRMPFIPTESESEILIRMESLLKANEIAALYVEPIQGSAGGHEATARFYRSLVKLCKKYNVISVFDEVLTGFFRAGDSCYCFANEIYPDILVFGKSIANGFPVSAVVMKNDIKIQQSMLPKSTFSSNPLACASISATLSEIRRLNVAERVRKIHDQIIHMLEPLRSRNYHIRGKGALWIIEPPSSICAQQLSRKLLETGVMVGFTDRYLRILPTSTISKHRLTSGLEKVVDSCMQYSR